MPQNPTQTIEITNFGGRLTRKLNGDLNSGFAKFSNSFGYDPFSKPDNLTWLEAPVDITGSITDLIVATKPYNQEIYALGNSGNLYTIQPNTFGNPLLDTPSVIGTVAYNSPSFHYGASMEFYTSSVASKIYVRSDNAINTINFDGSHDSSVTGLNLNYVYNAGGQLKIFDGSLWFGNGNTVGQIDTTYTVVSSIIGTGLSQGPVYSAISPNPPPQSIIHDMDVTPDGNYLLLTASNIGNEAISLAGNDTQNASSSDGQVYSWNGAPNTGITTYASIPSYSLTAQQTWLQNNSFFSNDAFGASLMDGTNKLLSLPNNKSPLPNATATNGNFITWVAPEVTPSGSMVAAMYYYGSLDQENQPGLWRMMRDPSTQGGFIYQTPVNLMVNGKYTSLNAGETAVATYGYGKHYFSEWDLKSGSNLYKLKRFLITPTGTGTPQPGVYESQTQIFSKKIAIKQIRFYTEPTASGNGFQLDCIQSDGSIITNGTFNYTYAAGTDPTLLQGALDRVDFNPGVMRTYSLGLRITNTGTTNMTIKKIEVDWQLSGQ